MQFILTGFSLFYDTAFLQKMNVVCEKGGMRMGAFAHQEVMVLYDVSAYF